MQTLPIYGIVQLINAITFYNYLNFWVNFFTKICIFVENWQTITNFLSAQDLPGVPAPCCHAIRQLPPPPIDPQKMFPANIATTAANKQTFTRDIFFWKNSLFLENVNKQKILSLPVKKCVTRNIATIQ